VTICIAVALAPALLFLWLFKRLDAKRPEPPGSVRNVVLFGVLSCIPAIIVELLLGAVLGDLAKARGRFLDAFLVAAFTEESLKLACVLLYLWRKPHFDEVMDGILYTAAASLGFAMIENVLYAGNNLAIGLLRAFTAVPMHALASALMGYFVGRARLASGSVARWIGTGLTVGVGIHGLYDWALMSEGGFGVLEVSMGRGILVVLLILIISAVFVRVAHKHALLLDDAIYGPHSRPLESLLPGAPVPAEPPRPFVGMPVVVLWTDGTLHPARLLGGQGAHFMCEFAHGGRHEWIPRDRVMPAFGAAPASG